VSRLIIEYSSTVYRDHKGLGFLAPKLHPKNQINVYFVTSRQDWLGIAKPQKCLQINHKPFHKVNIKYLKFLLFNRIFCFSSNSVIQ